jgi:hypothetical protein
MNIFWIIAAVLTSIAIVCDDEPSRNELGLGGIFFLAILMFIFF